MRSVLGLIIQSLGCRAVAVALAVLWGVLVNAQQPAPAVQDPPSPSQNQPAKPDDSRATDERAAQDAQAVQATSDGATPLKRLSKTEQVWLDSRRKLVVADATVVLREGLLEMFACPQGTKEHESILAVKGKPSTIHAALLAVGASSGKPVSFTPEYIPATGDPIEILVLWTDDQGKRHVDRAQSWVRRFRTDDKELQHDWVFAGSTFWEDPATKVRFYQGDAGDFVCVSNFPTATLDLPIPSSQGNEELLYEAFTERIPPVGTEVRLVFRKKPKQAQ